MRFLSALRRVLPGGDPNAAPPGRNTIETDPLLDEPGSDAGPAVPPEPVTSYDRLQWRKKLKRILEELPGSQDAWRDLVVEAKALELDPQWVAEVAREEFLLLIRRAVADRVVTEAEHRKLDLARDLIGISDAEAEASLLLIAAEAETFFGKPVREG